MYSLSRDRKGLGRRERESERERVRERERERESEREIVAGKNCDGVTHTSKHFFGAN